MSQEVSISSTLEDYLEAIQVLAGEKGKARVGDIAAALAVHKSTVTAALKTLTAKGLVQYAPYESATLTEAGRGIAVRVVHDHGVIKQFLTDVLQIRDSVAEENACRMEHVMDRTVMDRLVLFARRMREWRDSDNTCLRESAAVMHKEMRKAARSAAARKP